MNAGTEVGSAKPDHPAGLSASRRPGGIPPAVPPPRPGEQITPDFSSIDFDRLWAGRDKVTRVEGALLRRGLSFAPTGRALEIGSGGGRLTPFLARWSPEVIASDATPAHLSRSPARTGAVHRVAANAYHLPFDDRTFAAVTLVRVLGFLTDPLAALREVHRVLLPGGILILSFEPHPSLGTVVSDLKVGLSGHSRRDFQPMTFAREDVVPVRPSAFPAWSRTRSEVERLARRAGLQVVADLPCGLEDLNPFRHAPARLFIALAPALSRLGGFPSRFLVLRKPTLPDRETGGPSGPGGIGPQG